MIHKFRLMLNKFGKDHAIAFAVICIMCIWIGILCCVSFGIIASNSGVELGQYKNLSVDAFDETVSDEEIEAFKEQIVENMGYTTEVTDRTAQEGDTVHIQFYVKDANQTEETENEVTDSDAAESAEQDTTETSFVIGEQLYPELEEMLIGKSVGDVFEFTESATTEDEEDTVFKITIVSIQEPGTLTDDIAASLGIESVTDVDSLNEYLKSYIQSENKQTYTTNTRKELIKAVVDGSTVDTTTEEYTELVASYKTLIASQLESLASQYTEQEGTEVTVENLLAPTIENDDSISSVDDYIQQTAEFDAKEYLVFNQIAIEEGIEITDDMIYSAIVEDYKLVEDEYSTLLEFMDTVNKADYEHIVTVNKVADFIVDSATSAEDSAINDSTEATTNN